MTDEIQRRFEELANRIKRLESEEIAQPASFDLFKTFLLQQIDHEMRTLNLPLEGLKWDRMLDWARNSARLTLKYVHENPITEGLFDDNTKDQVDALQSETTDS